MTRISQLLDAGPTLSFEFFPPQTEPAQRALHEAIVELAPSRPDFVSVTCGAGGSTRDRTRQVVLDVTADQAFPAMPHVTCVGNTRDELDALLDDYAAHGIDNILALAGDPPADGSTPRGDFSYALELVEVVREHPHGFSVGVAAHPEVHPRSADRSADRRHLAAKLALADFALTQFFFDPADYFRMVDELAGLGIGAPVVPGVFPVTAPKTARRFADANGTNIPEDLFGRIEAAEGDVRNRLAVEEATALCSALLEGGAPGIHLYSMNRSEVAGRIVANLGGFR